MLVCVLGLGCGGEPASAPRFGSIGTGGAGGVDFSCDCRVGEECAEDGTCVSICGEVPACVFGATARCCGDGRVCSEGVCVSDCGEGTECNGQCCDASQMCFDGACAAQCEDPSQLCGDDDELCGERDRRCL